MIDRRLFLAGAGALLSAPAHAAPTTVTLPPVPRLGFKGATVPVPPLPSQRISSRVKVAAGRETRLPCCHATDLAIEGVSPEAYALDERRGVITAKQDIDATASYTATAHRYDAFGAAGYVAGTPRLIDPEEWGASGELYRLYVSRFGVEAIPVHAYENGVRRDRMAAHQAWLKASRKLLGGVLRKPGIKVMAYGHSIQAMGYRSPEMMTQANGPARDLMGYFDLNDSDTRAKFEQAGGHAREGYNYRLLDRLKSPTYLNFAIPGANASATTMTGGSVAYGNGGDPTRLTAAFAMKPDVAVIDFGVNDIGNERVYEQYLHLLGAFRDAGVPRIVLTPLIEHPAWRDRLGPTQYVRDSIIKAAAQTGSVVVDVFPLYEAGEEGAMGLSRWSHCAASLSNHPGRTELRAIGRLLASLAD